MPQLGLMHVRMRVFGAVVVGVGVLVLDMVVLMAGVRMRMTNFVVAVFVAVRFVVTVLIVCHCHPLCCRNPGRIHCALRDDALETIEGIRSGPQPSRRSGCRTVRMGLSCPAPGLAVNSHA